MQRSSFLNDQSQLSLLIIPPKSQLQLKCQQLLKQSSQYRCIIRQLKQDNQWLRTTNQGLQDQCNTLKDILREKKDMIGDCNSDLRMANQEINRLEDCLQERNQRMDKLQQQLQDKKVELENKNQVIKSLQYEIQAITTKLQVLHRQNEIKRQQYATKQKQNIQNFQERIVKILDQCNMKQKFQQKGSNENLFNELIAKIESLVQRETDLKTQLEEKIQEKQVSTENERKIAEILELQLKQASDLAEQFQVENTKNLIKIKQLEQKLQINMTSHSKNIEQTNNLYKTSINKIFDLIKPLFHEEGQTIEQLNELMKTSKNQYEIDIILDELRPIMSSKEQNKYQNSKLRKQAKQWQNKLRIMQEQFDTLKLKHATLQREFEAVIDDNRRILKFNQLSRYRTQRNTRSIYKQNNPNITNIKEFAYRK